MILRSLLSSARGFGGAELHFPTYPKLQTSTPTTHQTHLTLISFASHHSHQTHHCICIFLTCFFSTPVSHFPLMYSEEVKQWEPLNDYMYILAVWEGSLGGLINPRGRPTDAPSYQKEVKCQQGPSESKAEEGKDTRGWRDPMGVQSASPDTWDVNDTEGYQCGLRKGEMKSRIALQPSAGNAEGRGNES